MARQAGKDRAEPGCGREQHGGLAFDHVEASLFGGIGVADVEQLQHLAFGNAVGGIGEDAHDAHVVQLDHHLEGARIQEIAHQHAGRIAPQRVCRLVSAPQVRFVHHIVVQQGRGMDEFDQRGQRNVVVAAVAAGMGGQQVQHRPQALAAAADDVLGNLVDQHHIGRQAAADQGIDRRHVGARQGLDVVEAVNGLAVDAGSRAQGSFPMRMRGV